MGLNRPKISGKRSTSDRLRELDQGGDVIGDFVEAFDEGVDAGFGIGPGVCGFSERGDEVDGLAL